eukprot:403368665
MIFGLIIALTVFWSVTLLDGIYYPLYQHPWFAHYAIIIKCANNQISYNKHNRSFTRNFIFNLIRNLAKPTLFPLIFVGYTSITKIKEMLVVMTIATLVFQFLDWKLVKRYKYLWSFLQLNYVIYLPFGLFQSYNKAFQQYHGNLAAFVIAYFLEINFSLFGHSLEELIFNDLRYFNQTIFTNFYLPYTLTTFMILYLQFMLFGEKLSIRMPLDLSDLWHGTQQVKGFTIIDQKDFRHYPIFFYGNAIFMYFGYLSQLRTYARLNNWEEQETVQKQITTKQIDQKMIQDKETSQKTQNSKLDKKIEQSKKNIKKQIYDDKTIQKKKKQ